VKFIRLYSCVAGLTLLATACGGSASGTGSAAPPAAGVAAASGSPVASAPAASLASAAPASAGVKPAASGPPASTAAASVPPASTAAASAAASPKPAAAANPGAISGPAIDAIKQKKELVVGLEAAFEPFETLDNGKFVGFDVDLSGLMADGLGAKPKSVDTEFPGLVPGLQQKKFDTVISAVVITEARSQQVDFSQPYAESTQKILVRPDDDRVKSQNDLRGKTVGVQAGTTSEQLVRKLDEDFKKNGQGITRIAVYDHNPEIFLDLDTKRLDAAITLLPAAAQVMKKSPSKYKMASDFGPKSYVGIVTRKDTPDLGQYMDAMLGQLKQSGKLGELETTWFGAKSSGLPDKKLY
jgi:polar amino acid transport system substrate-binding protein